MLLKKLLDYLCYILTQCGFSSTALFLQFAFNTLLIPLLHSQPDTQKQIFLLSAFGNGFFETITKKMMTAMIKSPETNSDSDDSDTPPPPHSGFSVNPS